MTFREVIQNLNPHYIYGLTATPKRKHNDEKLIYAFIGDIVATMGRDDTNDTLPNGGGNRVPEIVIHDTALEIPFEWKTDRFQLLSKIVSFDTARNRLIADDIIEQVGAGERVLVLSERKEHLDILRLCLKGRCETVMITGEDTSAQRFTKLKRIKKGAYQVILSTGQFFGEGLHVDTISVLVLAFPFSFEGKLIQYIGRLLHSSNPKRVIDYRDAKVEFLDRQYKQRQRYYNKLKAGSEESRGGKQNAGPQSK
jgi:superfamily II DNA or RNA helicase